MKGKLTANHNAPWLSDPAEATPRSDCPLPSSLNMHINLQVNMRSSNHMPLVLCRSHLPRSSGAMSGSNLW